MKKKGILNLFLAFSMVLSLGGFTQAEAAEPGLEGAPLPGVYLYEDYDFEGDVLHFLSPGEYNLDDDYDFNDVLSSLRIVGDYSVVLYEDNDWTNTRSYFDSSVVDISDYAIDNDNASSIIIYKLPKNDGGLHLFEDYNFEGDHYRFGPGLYDLKDFDFNNETSSFYINGSYRVTFFQDTFSGASITVKSVTYLEQEEFRNFILGNDTITSIWVEEL
ncbi:beta/gamma crystallin-related protein [Bacillus spongiae]|uniref:Beta/gamma crystallin-related protein n=1 Tax=Bacillus spongiae TaxID=2683610 RepID=A0ABU8HB56_9BACI